MEKLGERSFPFLIDFLPATSTTSATVVCGVRNEPLANSNPQRFNSCRLHVRYWQVVDVPPSDRTYVCFRNAGSVKFSGSGTAQLADYSEQFSIVFNMLLNLLAFLLRVVNLSRDVCRNRSFISVVNSLTLLVNMLIWVTLFRIIHCSIIEFLLLIHYFTL